MADIYLHFNGEQKGPYAPEQVRAMVAAGEITPDTLAWRKGLSTWSTVSALLQPIGEAARPARPRPPVPEPANRLRGCWIAAIVVGAAMALMLPCCCGIALGPIMNGLKKAQENIAVQHARIIAMAMFSYSLDHHGNFPDGATSTAVCQKLLDGNYIMNPQFFYIRMPGKVAATTRILKAENVCFDITGNANKNSPQRLPLVFSTGYRMTYESKAKVYPDDSARPNFPGVAIAYKDTSSGFLPAGGDGSVDNVVPYDLTTGDSLTRWKSGPLDLAPTAYWQLKP